MDPRSERMQGRFDVAVTVAALLVIPLVIVEESDLGRPWEGLGAVLNWGTWLVFAAEIVVMLVVVPSRMRWIRENPLSIGVTLLTPPFVSVFAPARLLRLLRLLRLVRLAGLLRRVLTTDGLRYAAALATLTAVGGGAAFASLEPGRSPSDGVYWALTTMTTVGYGDLSPVTTGGKVLAVVVMLVGLGFVALVTGAVAQVFVERQVDDDVESVESAVLAELREIRARLDHLEAPERG